MFTFRVGGGQTDFFCETDASLSGDVGVHAYTVTPISLLAALAEEGSLRPHNVCLSLPLVPHFCLRRSGACEEIVLPISESGR